MRHLKILFAIATIFSLAQPALSSPENLPDESLKSTQDREVEVLSAEDQLPLSGEMMAHVLSVRNLPDAKDAALVCRQFYKAVLHRGHVKFARLKEIEKMADVQAFLMKYRRLLSLDVSRLEALTLRDVVVTARHMTNLHSITLSAEQIPDTDLRWGQLKICYTGVGESRRANPELSWYSSKWSAVLEIEGYSYKAIEVLALGPPLKSIALSRNRYSQQQLANIARLCPHIETLRIGGLGCSIVNLDSPSAFARTEDVLNYFPVLNTLILCDQYDCRRVPMDFWTWVRDRAACLDLSNAHGMSLANLVEVLKSDILECLILLEDQTLQRGLTAAFPHKKILFKEKPVAKGLFDEM